MLALRMMRNALSTLFLLVTLVILAVRLAPFYLPPEGQIVLQEALAKAAALATGRPEVAAPGAPTPQTVLTGSQDALKHQLEQLRDEFRQRHTEDAERNEVFTLPSPTQPVYQPKARPAYGVTAPVSAGAKRVRVGE